MLRAYVSKRQTNWEQYLPILEFAYNSAKHSTIGFSPFMLMYGFQSRSPIAVGLEKEKLQSIKELLEDMQSMLQEIAYIVLMKEQEIMLIKVEETSLSLKVTWSI